MTTTLDTVTDQQIEALRAEAAEAGDMAQVVLCDIARDTSRSDMRIARAKCAWAIADAEAGHEIERQIQKRSAK